MKIQRILKHLLIVVCLVFISFSLAGCGKNKFYTGAKKHLKDKYGVKCDSMIYYENARASAAQFGIIQLKSGEKVIVSLTDGNYADSYELMDLYNAWMEELSQELGVEVAAITVDSEGKVILSDGEEMARNLGTFIETSQVAYNVSNLDDFKKAFYDFTYGEEIDIYVNQPEELTREWMEDLAHNLAVYSKKVGAYEIEAHVYDSITPPTLFLYPDDFYYHLKAGDGREYYISYDYKHHNYYNTFHFNFDRVLIEFNTDVTKDEIL